jgi:hypothetical protein
MLCYTILYYTILYYTTLHYTTLHYTILYYSILHYSTLYYTILYHTVLHYTILYTRVVSIIIYYCIWFIGTLIFLGSAWTIYEGRTCELAKHSVYYAVAHYTLCTVRPGNTLTMYTFAPTSCSVDWTVAYVESLLTFTSYDVFHLVQYSS